MVYFNCGACSEALKKNQVEKHLHKCRNCHMVSCFDCGTEFWGNDYQKHIKCISEEEKYSGKNFVPKVNKGEAKQEHWIQQVQAAIEKSKCNPNVKKLLVSLLEYPNIPRKKIKFENFLGNSLRIRDKYLVSQVWDILMVDCKPTNKEQSANVEKKPEENGSVENSVTNGDNNETEKKLNKRERKEERQIKKSKKEKKHKNLEEGDHCVVEEKTKKKKKYDNNVEECEKTMTNGENHESRKSKKKRKTCDDDDDYGMSEKKRKRNEEDDEEEEEEVPTKKKTKFNWEEVITEVLQSKGEVSLKKLRKKVLSEFAAQGQFALSEEKLWSKFNKKVTKNPMFKVSKDRVKLAS